MSKKHKFDVGDVVRLNHGSFKENDGTLATVKSVRQTDGSPYNVLKLETVGGWRLEVLEYMVVGVSYDVGDVVRIIGDESGRHNGELAEVIAVVNVDWAFDDVLEIRTSSGLCATVSKEIVQPVTLEEVQKHYADKPRRGFIVDGLTVDETLVDELESGQDEAYESFQRAVKNATEGEWLESVEIRAKHKRLKRKVIMELIGTVAASVGLIGGLIRIAMDGLGLTEMLPALFCAMCVSVYAVSYEAGVIKGVCDEMKRIDSKLKRNDNEDDGIT